MTKIKSFFKYRYDKYFPTVRWPVLLIVLPALAIGLYYFLNVISEVVFEKRRSHTTAYERRFAAVQKDLPPNAYVNYITDQEYAPDFIQVRYALIPARLEYGLANRREFLVVQYLNSSKIPQFEGYTLKQNYGNGVMLFQRIPQ
jgi:hypothetical protein